jgi:predicted site-specific integrase-resolvase
MSQAPHLVTTAEAARALGVDRGTLARWWRAGKVEPDTVTVGGQGRWDLEHLREQLRALRQRPGADE